MRRTLLAAALVLASWGGCATEEPQPIDEALMAALGQARALHHVADVHLADGDAAGALEALERVLQVDFPAGAPERDDVVVDAHGRIAKVLLGQGKLDEADAAVERGLRETTRPTFYQAALHMISGEVHEARATAAREASDAEAARRHARAAIEAYERSIRVNQQVLDRLLSEGPAEATR